MHLLDKHDIFATVVVAVSAYISSQYTVATTKSKWYECIKPSLTPPAYVFPIVWSILYIIIAYCLSVSLRASDSNVITLFYINLVFNVVWCYLYFTQKSICLALCAICVVLWSTLRILESTTNNTVKFGMTLYMCWIAFATLLNYLSIKNQDVCNNQIE